jgi:AAHS family benzoate transporter-like MFS transporter
MTADTASAPRRSPLLVVAVCFLAVMFDGYDIIVYGSALPSLLAEPGWNLGPAEAGAIGAYALFGMLLGALAAGPVADRIGRRRVILLAIVWFSVLSAVAALAPDAMVFGGSRFLTGLGLGALLPSAVAMTVEFAPAHRRQFYNGLISMGFPIGGLGAALVALAVVEAHGWRPLFWVGALPLVVVLPLAALLLPESPGFLIAAGRSVQARATAGRFGLEPATLTMSARTGRRKPWAVVAGGRLAATAVLAGASFCTLLVVYGLNTWLPQLMRHAGYPLGSALQFQLLLNLGALVLGTSAAAVSDRVSPKWSVVSGFAAAAVCLLVMATGPGHVVLAIALFVAGLGGTATQALIHGYVAAYYPVELRATALGVVLAVGRVGAILGPVLGGLLAATGASLGATFLAFAAPAVVGGVIVSAGPRVRRHPAPSAAVEIGRPAGDPHAALSSERAPE